MITTAPKIQVTTNYQIFHLGDGNRRVSLAKHSALGKSMKTHGFLPVCPAVCQQRDDGTLIIRDGQHRVLWAESLGLPVYYVVVDANFDIAMFNSTSVKWEPIDFARKHSDNGVEGYHEALLFMAEFDLPITYAFAILAGTTTFGNIAAAFREGRFRIKEPVYALRVGELYRAMLSKSKALKGTKFLQAVMVACRIPGFDPDRVLHGASLTPEKLTSHATKDGYLQMIEELYNYRQRASNHVAIRLEANKAMRERSAIKMAA